MIFSTHLLTHLLFCIPIAITKSYFSWKKETRESQQCRRTRSLFDTVSFKEGGKRRIKAVIPLFAWLFVCLAVPVRTKDGAIADPRFSSAMKSDSSTLIKPLGGLVLLPFFWTLTWCQTLLHPSGTVHRTNAIPASLPVVRHLLWNTNENQNPKGCQEGPPQQCLFCFLYYYKVHSISLNFTNFVLNIMDTKDGHMLPLLL